jgi:hypothetical protein
LARVGVEKTGLLGIGFSAKVEEIQRGSAGFKNADKLFLFSHSHQDKLAASEKKCRTVIYTPHLKGIKLTA